MDDRKKQLYDAFGKYAPIEGKSAEQIEAEREQREREMKRLLDRLNGSEDEQ